MIATPRQAGKLYVESKYIAEFLDRLDEQSVLTEFDVVRLRSLHTNPLVKGYWPWLHKVEQLLGFAAGRTPAGTILRPVDRRLNH